MLLGQVRPRSDWYVLAHAVQRVIGGCDCSEFHVEKLALCFLFRFRFCEVGSNSMLPCWALNPQERKSQSRQIGRCR